MEKIRRHLALPHRFADGAQQGPIRPPSPLRHDWHGVLQPIGPARLPMLNLPEGMS
jgi:hypothetical protein